MKRLLWALLCLVLFISASVAQTAVHIPTLNTYTSGDGATCSVGGANPLPTTNVTDGTIAWVTISGSPGRLMCQYTSAYGWTQISGMGGGISGPASTGLNHFVSWTSTNGTSVGDAGPATENSSTGEIDTPGAMVSGVGGTLSYFQGFFGTDSSCGPTSNWCIIGHDNQVYLADNGGSELALPGIESITLQNNGTTYGSVSNGQAGTFNFTNCTVSGTAPSFNISCPGLITTAYQTVGVGGSTVTQRSVLNFINGSNITITCVDNSGASRTDCTVASSGGTVANFNTEAGPPVVWNVSSSNTNELDVDPADALSGTAPNGANMSIHAGQIASGATGNAAGGTLVVGNNDTAETIQSNYQIVGGDTIFTAGGTIGTYTNNGNYIPGNDRHMSPYRTAGTTTQGHLVCPEGTDSTGTTGHNSIQNCDANSQPVGSYSGSIGQFTNPNNNAVYAQWGGRATGLISAANESNPNGSTYCQDPNNPDKVVSNGTTLPCACPASRVGVGTLNETLSATLHTVQEQISGACVQPTNQYSSNLTVPSGSTSYVPFVGSTVGSTTESDVQVRTQSLETIYGLKVRLGTTLSGGQTVTITLRATGVSTSLTCTVPALGTVCYDMTDKYVPANANDKLDWQIVPSGTPLITNMTISFVQFGAQQAPNTNVYFDQAATNASVSTTTLVAVPTAGAMYRLTVEAKATDAGTGCTGTGSVAFTVGYTDADNNVAIAGSAQGFNGNSSTIVSGTLNLPTTSGGVTAANTLHTSPWVFSPTTTSPITIATTYTSGAGCSVGEKYAFHAMLEKVR